MKKTISFLLKKKAVMKDDSFRSLSKKFLDKSRMNLTTMSILSELNENEKAKELLKIPKGYDSNEWVVITGYYAMYTSALALLAKIGFKSKNHTATLLVLDEFFVKKKLLDNNLLSALKSALFQKEEIEKLSDARGKREIAQYSVTKETTKEIAKKIKKDAYEFINKVELILN